MMKNDFTNVWEATRSALRNEVLNSRIKSGLKEEVSCEDYEVVFSTTFFAVVVQEDLLQDAITGS